MTDFPRTPEDVDAPWLSSVLGAAVADVELESEIGTGQAARSVRFHLTPGGDAGEGDGALPSSVVGKFPSTDPGARATLEATGGYWKEWLFYDRLAAAVDVRVPACHAARFDPETSDFAILMEDLQGSSAGDQLDGLSVERVRLAVHEAARLHGPRWGEPGLEALLGSGPGASTLEEAGPFCEEMYAAVLPQFVERFADAVEPATIELVQRTAPFVARWFRGTGRPLTLVHQDLRADNLLFADEAGAPPVAVVDFQALTAGVGATDVAYLVGGSVADADERAAVERELLGEYGAVLAGYGVELSADELWRDHRHGSLWGLIMTVLSSIGAARTERGERMFAVMADRHARHATELDALAVLR